MRDNHEGLPEIIDAVRKDDRYFCVVALERKGEERRFQFGISRDGYLGLKRVFELRPVGSMPGTKSRWFFVPAYSRLSQNRVRMTVRVEQGREGKQMETEAPLDLAANLKWFLELEDWSKAEHLRVTEQRKL
jgi:hypothetical protein